MRSLFHPWSDLMGWASTFLQGHPDLDAARNDSKIWEKLKKQYAIEALGSDAYLVRGDTIGDHDDLYLDALARGSAPQSPDPLARRLYEELPPGLQQLVLRELRKISSEEQGT